MIVVYAEGLDAFRRLTSTPLPPKRKAPTLKKSVSTTKNSSPTDAIAKVIAVRKASAGKNPRRSSSKNKMAARPMPADAVQRTMPATFRSNRVLADLPPRPGRRSCRSAKTRRSRLREQVLRPPIPWSRQVPLTPRVCSAAPTRPSVVTRRSRDSSRARRWRQPEQYLPRQGSRGPRVPIYTPNLDLPIVAL